VAEHRKLTQAEMLAELKARFGDGPDDWAFQCPNCGDIATVRDFREALATHPRVEHSEPATASDVLGQECIGRTLGALEREIGEHYIGRGCNWAAYGLFRGPWEIVMPDGHSAWSFAIAPAPARAEADRG
jgi:hypothetical protein